MRISPPLRAQCPPPQERRFATLSTYRKRLSYFAVLYPDTIRLHLPAPGNNAKHPGFSLDLRKTIMRVAIEIVAVNHHRVSHSVSSRSYVDAPARIIRT